MGTIYDTYRPGTGWMDLDTANSWVESLNIGGVTGWRLPNTMQPDLTCSDQEDYIGDDGVTETSWGTGCTGSEMGNLFYNVLGGVAYSNITTTHNSNYELFKNVMGTYQSATEYAPINIYRWSFVFSNGVQMTGLKSGHSYAWAVHDGDIAAVPLPTAAWLFGSGFLGLVGIARRKKA